MYEMIVPGKYPVQVPPHLAGTVAVSIGLRLAWRVIATIICTILMVVISSVSSYLLFVRRMPMDDYNTVDVVGAVLVFAWLGVVVIRLVHTGATPLMSLTGVRWVRVDTGAPAGWAGPGKLLLQAFIGTLTFGVGSIIICFASMDEINRTWFDRTLGIVSINTKAGRDPYKTPVTPQPQAPAQPVVQPWNATASAAASLPPVPSVPSAPPSAPMSTLLSAPPAPPTPEPEATHVPWASAASDPVPTPPTQVSAQASASAATAPSSDYIGSTPWSKSDSDAAASEPAATEQPLSFSPSSSTYSTSAQAPDSSLPQDDADDRTQLGVRYDTARVTFDTGVTYPFGGTIVLGRNPLAPASHPTASPVPVDDPQRSVSKTHVALTATREGVLVEDLHSTGGTVVVRADGEETPVLPGAPVQARAGDTVRYGQRSVVIDG
ncbi:RDD family protein [Actinomyces bouchesdurhonensis]|uniref:RDD family protein n=1 Tax=Actinomyces bouchesdurhonensis TaxID=1852361 RepID=UPI0028EBDFB5|nr:RDD family protein [Actinomyces bouchesdurhonensis]